MKIGIICYKYPLYEQGSHLQEFVDSLAARSEKIVLISGRFPSSAFISPGNITFHWIPLIPVPLIGDFIFQVSVFIAGIRFLRGSIDLINVFSARPALPAFLLGKILKKPVVCTIEIINQDSVSFNDMIFNKIQRIVYSLKFNKIICWSRYYFDTYLSKWGIRKQNVEIIPAGINLKRFSPGISGNSIRNRYSPSSTVLVFAKPMYDYNRKMAELLLSAVKSLEKEITIYVLLGDGEERSLLESRIKELRMEDRVSFMPKVPITDIPMYLSASDFVVLPFTYKPTTSRSLLESLAMGKAVVTTRCGEIPAMLENGKDAIIVNSDINEIAGAIRKLAFDKSLRVSLGSHARMLAEREFSIDRITEKNIKLFRELIE